METRPRGINISLATIAGLAAFAWAIVGVTVLSLLSPEWVPHIFHNYHAEHLAAFYILMLLLCAGLPNVSMVRLGGVLIGYAVLIALVRMVTPTHRVTSVEDLLCDIAGVLMVAAPIVVGKLRRAAAIAEPKSGVTIARSVPIGDDPSSVRR